MIRIKNKRILVTGASGFIGTNLMRRVADVQQYDVVGVFNTRKPKIKANNIHYVQADLRNLVECREVVKNVDYVCMLAGRLSTTAIMSKNPLGPITDNTAINVNMLEAAYSAGVEKYLWLSSTTGYPQLGRVLIEKDFFESDPPTPYEPVGWMSRYIEKLSMLYSTKPKNPMAVISLRPTAVFGEYDDFDFETCHALPALVRRVVERHSPIEIWGSGDDERDWLYIDDLIDACLLALERIKNYVAVNVGSGRSYNLMNLLSKLLEIDNYLEAKVVHYPRNNGQVLKRQFDCSRAKELFSFSAKTAINDGLKKTICWYKDNI